MELQAPKLAGLSDAGLVPALPRRGTRLAAGVARAWYELRKSRTAFIGFCMLVLLFGACIATPWIATHDPIKQSYRERLAPPSEKHYLGTDRLAVRRFEIPAIRPRRQPGHRRGELPDRRGPVAGAGNLGQLSQSAG